MVGQCLRVDFGRVSRGGDLRRERLHRRQQIAQRLLMPHAPDESQADAADGIQRFDIQNRRQQMRHLCRLIEPGQNLSAFETTRFGHSPQPHPPRFSQRARADGIQQQGLTRENTDLHTATGEHAGDMFLQGFGQADSLRRPAQNRPRQTFQICHLLRAPQAANRRIAETMRHVAHHQHVEDEKRIRHIAPLRPQPGSQQRKRIHQHRPSQRGEHKAQIHAASCAGEIQCGRGKIVPRVGQPTPDCQQLPGHCRRNSGPEGGQFQPRKRNAPSPAPIQVQRQQAHEQIGGMTQRQTARAVPPQIRIAQLPTVAHQIHDVPEQPQPEHARPKHQRRRPGDDRLERAAGVGVPMRGHFAQQEKLKTSQQIEQPQKNQ